MKLGVTRKIKMGASIITALSIGAIGVVSPSTSTRAAESQLQLLASSSACTVVHGTGPHSVRATTSDCYLAQAAVYCRKTLRPNVVVQDWYYGPKSKDSRAYCPSGYYAIKGAKRAQATSTSPLWDWYYFDI
jgi:hypothetical protein